MPLSVLPLKGTPSEDVSKGLVSCCARVVLVAFCHKVIVCRVTFVGWFRGILPLGHGWFNKCWPSDGVETALGRQIFFPGDPFGIVLGKFVGWILPARTKGFGTSAVLVLVFRCVMIVACVGVLAVFFRCP